jgi:hypothetical protein
MSRPQDLKALKDQINELKKFMSKHPGDVPLANRPAFEIRQRESKDELDKVSKEFFLALDKCCHKLFLTGSTDKNAKFVELLGKSVTVFVPTDIYGEAAAFLDTSLTPQRAFTSESWRRFLTFIGDYARRYGCVARRHPSEPAGICSKDFVDLRNQMKTLVEHTFDYDLAKANIQEQVFNLALKAEIDGGPIVVPIYVNSLDERDIINATLFKEKPSYTVTFEENEEVTQDGVDKLVNMIVNPQSNKRAKKKEQ